MEHSLKPANKTSVSRGCALYKLSTQYEVTDDFCERPSQWAFPRSWM